MTRSLWLAGASAALVAALACDSQVGPDYAGEALAALGGTMSSDGPLPSGELHVQLRWATFLPMRDAEAVSQLGSFRGPGSQQFPDRFQFELFERPSRDWLNDFSQWSGASARESRIGLAQFGIAGDGTISGGWHTYSRHAVVYVERDIQPGTVSEKFVGGVLDAGFHLLEVVDAPCDSYLPDDEPLAESIDCLRPAPDDLEAEVALRFLHPDGELYDVRFPWLYPSQCLPNPPCED